MIYRGGQSGGRFDSSVSTAAPCQPLLPFFFSSLYSDINMKLKLVVKYSKIIGTITGRIQFTG